MAVASLILGIVSLVIWFIMYVGVLIPLLGLIFGIIKIRRIGKSRMAKAGVVMCSLALTLSIINHLMAWLRMTGIWSPWF